MSDVCSSAVSLRDCSLQCSVQSIPRSLGPARLEVVELVVKKFSVAGVGWEWIEFWQDGTRYLMAEYEV